MNNEETLPLCECGCGERVTKAGNKYIQHHHHRGKPHLRSRKMVKPKPEPTLCECGCGKLAKPGNRFINGHGRIGKKHSSKTIAEMIEKKLKEKEPLSKEYEIDKYSGMAINKDCAQYLGCFIAERLLSKLFKDVQVMPHGNPGYDFICGKGLMIDIKSSATGYKGYWVFLIRKNEVADYFLCIAFENREDLNPVHLWLIPGKDINHFTGVSISKSTIEKWCKYEQPIGKVIECCNKYKVIR